jgi:hypothetical protein
MRYVFNEYYNSHKVTSLHDSKIHQFVLYISICAVIITVGVFWSVGCIAFAGKHFPAVVSLIFLSL